MDKCVETLTKSKCFASFSHPLLKKKFKIDHFPGTTLLNLKFGLFFIN